MNLYKDIFGQWREELPKRNDPNCWCAPEHINIAATLERDKRGIFILPEHSIFVYSRENPPYWVSGAVRITKRK